MKQYLIIFISALLLALPTLSLANMSSASYSIKGGTISSGGSTMSSASYTKSGIVIGSAVYIPAGPPGPPSSASYSIKPLVYTPLAGGAPPSDSTAPVTTAAPLGGAYTSARSVTLSCNDSSGSGCANTYYTTDGTTPTLSSNIYGGAISITSNTLLQYFSRDANGNSEAVKSQKYIFLPPAGGGAILTWTPTGNPTTVYRASAGEDWTQIGSTTGVQGTYTDNTPPPLPNTIYRYAISTDGGLTFSEVFEIRTPLYNGWNIVGVPYNTTGIAAATLFGNPVSAVYEWVPTGSNNPDYNGRYVTVPTLTPGKGYFVSSGNNTMLFYSGAANPASVNVVLKPGYTLISNTQTSNMTNIGTTWLIDGAPMSTFINAPAKIGGSVYWWDGIAYDSWSILGDNPTIEPWKAYWILNMDTVNHTLTIQSVQ